MKTRLWMAVVVMIMLAAGCGTPEEKKTAFFEKGKAFFEQGEYVKARLELKNAVQIDAEFAQAYYMLGRTALKLKNGKGAFQNFSAAVKYDPDHIDARLNLGKMFAAGKAWDRALAQVAEVLGREPQNSEAMFLQASVLFKQKKNEEAKAVLDGVAEAAKQGPEYHLLLASYYGVKGQVDAVGRVLNQGLEKNPEAMPLIMALANYYGRKQDAAKVEELFKKGIAVSPEAYGLKFNLAWLYLRTNAPEKAVDIVKTTVAEHPDEDRLRVAGAVLLMKGGLKDESIKMINDGMALHPAVYAYYGLLSEISLKEKKLEQASAMLEKFIGLGDEAARADLIKARLNLSKLFLFQKKEAEAEALIDEVLAEDTKNVDAHYLKGRIYLARKDGPAAVSKFRSVINDYPDHMEGYLGLAHAHALTRDYDLAMDVLKTALKKKPDSTGILKAMVKLNLALKDTTTAEENLKKIVSLDPYNLGSIAGLGDFYLATNRYEEAIEQYRLLKEKKQGHALGYLKTANALARQNKVDQAIEEMTQGYEDNKKSSVFITSLARLYAKEGRYEEAIGKFREAIAVDPGNGFAWFSLAQIHERQKDYPAAMAVYEKILKDNPDSWMAANNLAFYLIELGNSDESLDRALELAKRADTLNPGSPLVGDTLGWALYKKGEVDKARPHIEAAYEKMPDNDSIAYHLGAVNHSLGRKDAAGPALAKSLEKDGDFVGRDQAEKLYKEFYAQ